MKTNCNARADISISRSMGNRYDYLDNIGSFHVNQQIGVGELDL